MSGIIPSQITMIDVVSHNGVNYSFTRENGRFVFTGGKTGTHSINADSLERGAIHWTGYLENNGVKHSDLRNVAPGMTARFSLAFGHQIA